MLDESDPLSRNARLDPFDPSNGFIDPPLPSQYSGEFVEAYRAAQRARIARIDERFTHDAPTAGRAEEGLRRLLPALADVKVDAAWGGPIDVSADHFPMFGTVPGRRIHYGAGYSGNGVGPSWLGGQILARLALGADDELTRLPLVNRRIRGLPPEPVKHLGGALVRGALLRVEESEQAGRRPPLAARWGAALPSLLGLRIGTR